MIKPARGRPRSFNAEAMLTIVADRFRDGGYSATSLDAIAEATGLNRPSLYAAYGDKKAMYLAALARVHDGTARIFDRIDAAAPDLRDSVAMLFAASIASYLAGPHGARGCLAIGTAPAEAVMDADIRAALDHLVALIDARIALWFVARGASDGAARARLVGSVLHSLAVRARAGAPRETLEAIAADAIELLVPR